ncbi:uncharacterized protein [Aegilops tauschii subsp. strangulata]|uniref:uncharacterized protein n=1 Tax=Aegilops tauschii subsp. strangulata TaxID=200361 RepID=UPI00098B105A|nr:uncharacterized protein LOC109779141 [Aegilops tauschii subsp. strangulata]
MAKDQRQSAWTDLQPDLLLLVLHHLTSLLDRVRAGAVCRSWRSASSLLPPTRLPWVVFGDGTLFDLANDSAPHPHYRLRLPDDCWRYSAGENMLFLVHQRDGSCSLMNALSGARTDLPELAAILRTDNLWHRKPNELRRTPHDPHEPTMAIGKVVLSSAPDDPIVAVLLENKIFVSTCRPAGESNSCLLVLVHEAVDMVLFQGQIYALSIRHVLSNLNLINGHLDKPTPPGVEPKVRCVLDLIKNPWSWQQHEQDEEDVFKQDEEDVFADPLVELYLVESGGKLLMVKRWLRRPWMPCFPEGRRTFCLQVWEADISEGQWKKLDGSLEGRALFVSRSCSKSLPVGHGVREDCIYFLKNLYVSRKPNAPLGDFGVYNVRDKTFTPLLLESMPSLPWKSGRFPSWFFHGQV